MQEVREEGKGGREGGRKRRRNSQRRGQCGGEGKET